MTEVKKAAQESHQDALEAQAKALFDAGRLERAFTLMLEAYGGELYAYVRFRNASLADDVVGESWLAMWAGFPRFRWVSSFRSWAFIITKRCLWRLSSEGRRQAPMGEAPDFEALLRSSRGSSAVWRPLDLRTVLARVGGECTEEDLDVAFLREVMGLRWNAIALGGLPEGSDEAALERESARLRKRHQRLWAQIRAAMGLE